MRNQAREIDRTFLSLDLAEERGLIHRDYIAHCFRWSHVVKFLINGHRFKDAIVLDVGCGKEMPLAKTLYVNKMTPKKYVGVDANKFDVPDMLKGKKIPITIWPETDFCALEPEDVWFEMGNKDGRRTGILPNVLSCLEVLEHVQPEHCRRMLTHFGTITSPDVNMFISTPCYNGSAADNHINEMTFAALGSLIEDLGYNIEGVYGTFASISDYKDQLSAVTIIDKDTGRPMDMVNLTSVFAALRNYYDTNVLAIMFAPLFPAQSRNCLWHLTKKTPAQASQARIFSALSQAPTPWSMSKNWRDLDGPAV